MLYFAYGSNMNYLRMISRCPEAKILGVGELKDYRLCFMENNSRRIVANIESSENNRVIGILYEVSDSMIRRLDGYEGVPFVYHRINLPIEYKSSVVDAEVYIMESICNVDDDILSFRLKFNRNYGVPKDEYFNHILKGYTMFNLNQRELVGAVEYSSLKIKSKKSKERKSKDERCKSSDKKTTGKSRNKVYR